MTVSDPSSLWANLVGLSHSIRPGILCAIDKTQPTMPQETRSGHPCCPKLQTLLSIWAEMMHPIRLCNVPSLQVSWYSCFFQAQNLVAKAGCCLVRILLFLLWSGASPLYLDLGFGILPPWTNLLDGDLVKSWRSLSQISHHSNLTTGCRDFQWPHHSLWSLHLRLFCGRSWGENFWKVDEIVIFILMKLLYLKWSYSICP